MANKNTDLIKILKVKPVVFNPILARIAGDVASGLFLSQLLYWDGKGKEGGWIYKTIEEFQEETALSRKNQDRAVEKWKKLGVLETEVRGTPPTRHFRINEGKLRDLISNLFVQSGQIHMSKVDKYICPKRTNTIIGNTEITSEITSEITRNLGEPASEPVATVLQNQSKNAVNELIESFSKINPSYRNFYANKTQRAAADRIIQAQGLETAQKIIGFLDFYNSLPHPHRPVTTPALLEADMAAIRVEALKIRKKQQEIESRKI